MGILLGLEIVQTYPDDIYSILYEFNKYKYVKAKILIQCIKAVHHYSRCVQEPGSCSIKVQELLFQYKSTSLGAILPACFHKIDPSPHPISGKHNGVL